MRVAGSAPAGYRPTPPAPVQRIVWPAGFGTRFLVFCDVEEEFNWSAPLDRANRSTTAMAAFPGAHRRFVDRGIGLACMVDHPVATDPRAVDIMRAVVADGRSAIGAQLHSWVTPPYADPMPGDSYAGNLPMALEAAKLDTLTAALTNAFGAAPTAYRAGRYGIGPATIGLLAERGYVLDSSVRARYDYRADGGPDFTAIDNHAYRWGPLVELPLTTVFTGGARRSGAMLYPMLGRIPHARGVAARTGILQRVALTPEDMPVDAAIEAVRVAVGEGVRLLTFSFHSPTLMPGHTPYVRDDRDLVQFWTWWERMFATLDRLGVASVTLDEVIAATT